MLLITHNCNVLSRVAFVVMKVPMCLSTGNVGSEITSLTYGNFDYKYMVGLCIPT